MPDGLVNKDKENSKRHKRNSIPESVLRGYKLVFPVARLQGIQVYKLHCLREGGLSCFYQQMNMIRHKHIGIDNKSTFFFITLYSFKIFYSVLFIKKNILLLIATNNNMIKCPGKFYTWWPCHCENIITSLNAYPQA